MKTTRSSLFLIALATIASALPLAAATAAAHKPNIVFVLADDLGIDGVSCYGADKFKTPHIDALAKSGLRFEHCYAAPLCGPSRALLLTGRYAYRTGMTANYSGKLMKPENETLIPAVLKPAGYVTGMVGKWAQLPLQPVDWGFDEYLRFNNSGRYWNTQDGNRTYMVNGKETPLQDGEYLPDKMHEFAVSFIQHHQDQPFFLYYSMAHVHEPILRTPDTVPGTTNKFQLYQDNVAYMDKLVGKLLAELDRLKLRENTLVVFAGDNGTASFVAQDCTINGGKRLSGSKGSMLECGALVPGLVSWPGQIAPGQVSDALIDLADFLPTFAELAGAKLPANRVIDGLSFAPQLRGKSTAWPRTYIFTELGRHWYNRELGWKLNEAGELFDMKNAPFAEPRVASNTSNETAIAARRRLQAILDQLNPAGGIVDPGDGSGRWAGENKKSKPAAGRASPNAANANEPDQ